MKILNLLLLFSHILINAYAGERAVLGVVIIDMQPSFMRDASAQRERWNALVTTQLELITWARTNKAPVVVFEFESKGKTDRRILSALRGHRHMVITKRTDDGFSMNIGTSGPLASDFFFENDVNTLIVSGINGGSCVRDTIQGAAVNGFNVRSSNDLVGDFTVLPATYPDSAWRGAHPRLRAFGRWRAAIQN